MQKFEEIFKIFLAPFNVEVESAPPNLQMELIELQANIELKCLYEGNNKLSIIKNIFSKINFQI